MKPWFMLLPFIISYTLLSWHFGIISNIFPRPADVSATIQALQSWKPVSDINLTLFSNLFDK